LPLIVLFGFSLAATVTLILAAWIVLGIATDIRAKTANKESFGKGLRALSYSYFGMQFAHFGIAVMLVGVALTSYFSIERSVLLDAGEQVELGEYEFTLLSSERIEGPNYVGDAVTINVSRDGEMMMTLVPERRLYIASGTPSTEMAIDAGFFRDLFITLGEQRDSGGLVDDGVCETLCTLDLAGSNLHGFRSHPGCNRQTLSPLAHTPERKETVRFIDRATGANAPGGNLGNFWKGL
jgi:cytochrome c-type biogenesis protein CcmF